MGIFNKLEPRVGGGFSGARGGMKSNGITVNYPSKMAVKKKKLRKIGTGNMMGGKQMLGSAMKKMTY